MLLGLAIMSHQDEDLGNLNTELIDTRFANIDQLSTLELVTLFNESDQGVALAVQKALPTIAQAIDEISKRMSDGGRLFYVGAGTSGRLGVLDASECIPTFSINEGVVIALIAGGDVALRKGVEGAEDLREGAHHELKVAGITSRDSVVGIAASGRTPYVVGALEFAESVGALTVALTCNLNSEISKVSQYAIEIDTGPEVLAGSTRLKAGTAQKLVLNMISTTTMINLGKTYGNLMVDLQVTNTKLKDRAIRIIQSATQCDAPDAERALREANNQVKVAIVSLLMGLNATQAAEALTHSNSRIRKALQKPPHA